MAADKLFYEDDSFYDDCTDADYEEAADAFKDDLQDKFLDEAEFDEFVQEPIRKTKEEKKPVPEWKKPKRKGKK